MKIAIIDGSSYFYRAFFGDPQNPVGALRAMVGAAIDCHAPDRVVVALDAGRETFRNQIFPAYKSNRPPSPEGYSEVLPEMKRALTDMGIEAYSLAGYEADDIIGTLCAKLDTCQRIILSRDKDLMQLVKDPHASMWSDGWIREEQVVGKFGVHPGQVVDVMGLQGDGADGIPGVAGIGAKIASALIQHFNCLEILFDNLNLVPSTVRSGARIQKILEQSREVALLSRALATIKTDVPLEFD